MLTLPHTPPILLPGITARIPTAAPDGEMDLRVGAAVRMREMTEAASALGPEEDRMSFLLMLLPFWGFGDR